MEKSASKGWLISDLHRRRLPYYGFKMLAWAHRWHSFVRHDGPLSFRRSFLKENWLSLAAAAGLNIDCLTIDSRHLGRLFVSRVK
jgi:hypothetical protein